MSATTQDKSHNLARLKARKTGKTPDSWGFSSDFSDSELAYPAVSSFSIGMDFRVQLETFRGPMDLLLYLVRKHEVDISQIPVSRITDQYLEHLQVLHQLDVDAVGDFVEVASLLIEAKSREVLPVVEEVTVDEAIDQDPRDEIVARLLEYKQYKDAASMLDDSARQWQQRYTRLADDLPPRSVDPAEQPIHEVELWDLVSAMGRLMRETRSTSAPAIVYDDTPIHVHMQKIHDELIEQGRVAFTSMFRPGMMKSTLIGIFLGVLELVRNFGVIVEQEGLHSEMWLTAGENFKPTLEVSEIFEDSVDEEDVVAPAKPR